MDLILDTLAIRDKNCWRRSCVGANLDEKLWIIRQTGWAGAELWDDDVKTFLTEKTLEDLQWALGRLTIPSYKYLDLYSNWCAAPDPHSLIERAARIGAKSIVCALVQDNFAGGATPPLYLVAEQVKYLLDIAEKHNMPIGLEFLSFAPCYNTLKDAVAVVNKVNHPLVKLVLDTFHIWKTGDKNFDTFERNVAECELRADQISVVHMADANYHNPPQEQQKDCDRKIPGIGLLNLPRFIKLLTEMGYTGPLVLDLYDKSFMEQDPANVSGACFHGMESCVKAAKCL